jgi:hypothetical protein
MLTKSSPGVRRFIVSLVGAVACVALPTGGGTADAQGKDESLNDFFNLDGAGLQRLARQQQEAISTCMKKAGFEYKVVGLGDFAAVIGDGFDPETFAEKYGYGVSTLIDPNKAGKPATLDANAALLAKMSAGQKKAYNKALTGSENTGADTAGFGASGCVGESTKRLFSSLTKLQALGPKFSEIQSRVNNNPKVLAGMKEWSACMKQAGYTFRTDSEPPTTIGKELNALVPPGGAAGAGAGLAGAFGGGVDASKIDPAKLRALQKRELRVSKSDRECTKKHLKDREALQKAEEKKFIETNRTVLEAVRTELGGKKK